MENEILAAEIYLHPMNTADATAEIDAELSRIEETVRAYSVSASMLDYSAAVLGGLVAGPALMALGFVANNVAGKKLDQAYTNQAEAIQITEELNTGARQCEAIRRRTNMFYNLLARLDARFVPLIYGMEDIIRDEGEDYRSYTADSKKLVASCASIAVTIKSVLDTPLLTDGGLLTGESETIIPVVQKELDQGE